MAKRRRNPEHPKKKMVKEDSKTGKAPRTADVWAVQCEKCLKWRTIPSQEEFEEIRSKIEEDPFFCGKKASVCCDDPADMEYDSTRTWVVDKPNIPKTPVGFKRRLVLRKDFSKMDTYYHAPNGKLLRSSAAVAAFLRDHPQFHDLSPSDFCFIRPKIMGDTIPEIPVSNE